MYDILIHPATHAKVVEYLDALRAGDIPGGYLKALLARNNAELPDAAGLLEMLVNTKHPKIFAESSVRGDGADWNASELSILGDLSVAVPVIVYDDGRHSKPHIHESPFAATLLYTPGALLRNGQDLVPADWNEVTHDDRIDQAAYNALYERRLLPLFHYVNEQAKTIGHLAVITVPGLGCGQFAGSFRGKLGECLRQALVSLLERNGQAWSNIAVVWFDPYSECTSAGHAETPQLCPPGTYRETSETGQPLYLYSVVAWDHVSWPGNDFYAGARATDDGVKAAATSSMKSMTGFEGRYDPKRHEYRPPEGYRDWEEVVRRNQLTIRVRENLHVLPRA
jgi:hypothetical protein